MDGYARSFAIAVGLFASACPKSAPQSDAPKDAPAPVATTTASASASAAPVPTGPTLSMEEAATSSDGKRIASMVIGRDAQGIERYEIHLWDAATKARLRTIASELPSPPRSMVFTTDGKILYVAWENAPPTGYDVVSEKPPAGKTDFFAKQLELPPAIKPETDRGVGDLAVSDDGVWLAGRCATVNVCVWKLATGAVRMWDLPAAPANAEPEYGLAALRFDKGTTKLEVETDTGRKLKLDVVTLKTEK